MYERIETSPGTIGIRLGETLTIDEINQLYADAAEALTSHERLNYFVDARAWSHAGLQAGLHSLKMRLAHLDWFHRFERVAVVTDSVLLGGSVKLLDLLTPMMDVRAFSPADVEAGLRWCEGG
ncbi:STAS/SEC14 domain-containing protein [Sandaracinobacter neustonicus]|uniref:STAS/SEC14 domain-containing protein n=1 Tax=Sandaracinobacter neustonicus TaxID=1715348 RepID=A0A501XSD2_9SPHN|nr:STAS/SEC14 domain-containing protein [Sandaracinobacter neustonicus]TPE63299.1 STAS/SEC14 domain-containing protein [Sandaracinobacter neustonicus]